MRNKLKFKRENNTPTLLSISALQPNQLYLHEFVGLFETTIAKSDNRFS